MMMSRAAMTVQKYTRKAVNRIIKDFKQKELIWLKILFFVQATTIAVFYPYLTIHMRDLGISIEEIAIMSAVIPVIGIFAPPLAGMIADKIGNFKILLAMTAVIGGLTALLLFAVPPAKIEIQKPEKLVFDFGCGSDLGLPSMKISETNGCERIPTNERNELSMRLETCGLVCQAFNLPLSTSPHLQYEQEDISDVILKSKIYSVKIVSDNETKSALYNLTGEREILQTKDFSKSIRHISGGDLFFFPSPKYYRLYCRTVDSFGGSPEQSTVCYVGSGEDELSGDGTLAPSESNVTEWFGNRSLTLQYDERATFPNFDGSTCLDPKKGEEAVTVSVYFDDLMTDVIELSKCEARCLITAGRKELCSDTTEEIEKDPTLTFWTYFIVRLLIGITGSTTYSMFEVAVITILREHKADYGLQRIYATIGAMIASPISGFLIDYASDGKSGTDYSPAFYLYAGLKILSAVLTLFIDLEFKKGAKSVIADFIQVMKNAEVLSLLTCCFILGACWGYIESFLFLFLQELGGNKGLMGITLTVGGLAGIPLLVLSGPIVNKIGHANVIFITFVVYAIRMLGYSLIYNPYDCLYFEAMESITTSLAITAAITYGAKLSTTTTDGSIQGLVGGLYYTVGKGTGTLVGGYLTKAIGTRETFQIFAAFSLGMGFIYLLIYRCYIRKLPNRENNEICKKEPKIPEVQDDIKIITVKGKETEEKMTEPENKCQTESAELQKTEEEYKNEGYVRTEDNEDEGETRQEQTRAPATKTE